MVNPELRSFLSSNHIPFDLLRHPHTITAQETAASAHVPGRELAKTVMVKIDHRMVMVVLPACHRLDLEKLRQDLGAATAELADEREFASLFPDCEAGAMPPFGNLYGIKVVVAEALTRDRAIAFNAGTHRDLVRIAFSDYRRVVEPRVFDVSYPS